LSNDMLASWNSTNPRITIVEADIALALALSHNLKTEGYVVESVDRGDEAVRKLADAPPDLVILDWMLPGISGPEICIRLRAEDETRMLPIIMLSARGDEILRLRGFSAGADDFVVKPFSMRELIARVCALLRRSRFAIAGRLIARGDSSTRSPNSKGPPGLARGPSQTNGIPAARMFARAAWQRLFSAAPFGARLGAMRRHHRSGGRCPHRTSSPSVVDRSRT
jgi:DNA-binding response OmpR family regulator